VTRAESGVIEYDGGALAWESAGEGPDVVFLHPGLWDGRTWDEQFGVFSRIYRVLRFDFRGYGRSSRPEPGKPYSHVDDLAAVMDAASVERAALVGCSMGGINGHRFRPRASLTRIGSRARRLGLERVR